MLTAWFKVKENLRTSVILLGCLFILAGVTSRVIVQKVSAAFTKGQESSSSSVNPEIVISSNDPIRVLQTFYTGQYSPDTIPVRVVIPAVSIDLSIKQANVVDGKWEVFDDTASFGMGSYPLGMAGNTVIFAHARYGMFLPLRNVKMGDPIYVFSETGWYKYQVEDIKTVNPNDISVINKSDDERITLYTCSSYADLKRLVVVAKRIG